MNLRDAVYPLLAAVCYSTNPILAKLGLRISNEPILGACIGMVASALVYIAYFFGSGQSRRLWSMPRAAGWYFGLAGLATTVAIFTMFGALQYLPAAVVAPLSSAAPLFTLVLSQLALRDIERVTRSDVIGTLLIVAGVVVLVS